MSQNKTLTTASGAPVADNQNSRSAGPRGPLLLDDFHLIEKLAREGRAVIVVSSELPEVIRVSDRVLVMRQGRISATLGPAEISEANIAHNAIPA
mgnify:CR=1 FL=1